MISFVISLIRHCFTLIPVALNVGIVIWAFTKDAENVWPKIKDFGQTPSSIKDQVVGRRSKHIVAKSVNFTHAKLRNVLLSE